MWSYLHARASFEAPYEKSHRQVRSPRPYGIRSDEATEATLHRLEAQGVQGRGPDGQELDAALCDSAQGWAANACGYSEVSDSGHEGQASADAAGLHSCLAHCSLGSGVGGAEPSGDADNREPELNEATLFVGDLAKEVNELDLRRAFTEHGQVLSVDIKRDRRTRSSLGYGFVQYASRRCVRLLAGPGDPGTDSAGVAAGSARAPRPRTSPQLCVCPRSEACQGKRAMQKCKLGSRTIRVGWAQKNTNLFVGDLDSSVSNEMLRRAFGAFGALVIEDTFMKVRAFASFRAGFERIERTRPAALRSLPHAREGSLFRRRPSLVCSPAAAAG